MALDKDQIRALTYVRSMTGEVTVRNFDDDHGGSGPALRQGLMPRYFVEDGRGRLQLTPAGTAALAEDARS